MKKQTIQILRFILGAMALTVLVGMLRIPVLEGRNVNSTIFQVYFNDPFLLYAYTGSVAFFIAIYQGIKLLGYTNRPKKAKALQSIRQCAIVLIAFILGAEAYFFIAIRGTDDIAGGVMSGLVLIVISTVVGVTASILENKLK